MEVIGSAIQKLYNDLLLLVPLPSPMATSIPDEGLFVFAERARGQVVLITGECSYNNRILYSFASAVTDM